MIKFMSFWWYFKTNISHPERMWGNQLFILTTVKIISIYSAFSLETSSLDNLRIDDRKFLFKEILKIFKWRRNDRIDCHSFCNPCEIMDPNNAHQWLLTLLKETTRHCVSFDGRNLDYLWNNLAKKIESAWN